MSGKDRASYLQLQARPNPATSEARGTTLPGSAGPRPRGSGPVQRLSKMTSRLSPAMLHQRAWTISSLLRRWCYYIPPTRRQRLVGQQTQAGGVRIAGPIPAFAALRSRGARTSRLYDAEGRPRVPSGHPPVGLAGPWSAGDGIGSSTSRPGRPLVGWGWPTATRRGALPASGDKLGPAGRSEGAALTRTGSA